MGGRMFQRLYLTYNGSFESSTYNRLLRFFKGYLARVYRDYNCVRNKTIVITQDNE